MSFHHSPRIVTNGLGLYLDASNPKSYPGTGDAWYDLSGNNFHMSLKASAESTFTSASNDSFLKYFDLNGSTHYGACDGTVANSVSCDTGSFVSGSEPRTVVAVFQIDEGNGNTSQGIFDYGTSGVIGQHYCLRLNASYTAFRAQFWGTPDYDFNLDTRNNFSMVSVTYGTDEIGRTYVNAGELLGEDGFSFTLVTGGNRPFEMGRYQGSNNSGAKISAYMFYTKALTPEECAQNYYALRSRWGG